MDDVLKNNKLIAEFMGGKQTNRGYFIPYWCLVNMNSVNVGKGKVSEYHKSWDWLMPCCKKYIETYPEKCALLREYLSVCDIDKIYKQLVFLLSH